MYGLFGLSGLLLVVAGGLLVAAPDYASFAWLPALVVAGAALVPRSPRLAMVGTSAVAAFANAYLLYLKVAPDAGSGFCPPVEQFDCGKINNSPASVLFNGTAYEVPITLLGLAFFVGLAVAAASAPKGPPRLFQVGALFGGFNLLVSAYLGYVMVSEGHLCIFCISIYASNIAMMWAAFSGLKEAGSSLLDGLPQVPTSQPFFTVAGLFLVVTVGGQIAIASNAPADATADLDSFEPSDASAAALSGLYTKPAGVVRTEPNDQIIGKKGSAYTIVEFASFACPHCKNAFERFKPIIDKADDIALHFVPVASCMPEAPNEALCYVTRASLCAGDQGLFGDLGKLIYANQYELFSDPTSTVASIELLAKQADVDLPEWHQCMASPEAFSRVNAGYERSQAASIGGYPHFFLKGAHGDEWISLGHDYPSLAKVISAHREGVELSAPTK